MMNTTQFFVSWCARSAPVKLCPVCRCSVNQQHTATFAEILQLPVCVYCTRMIYLLQLHYFKKLILYFVGENSISTIMYRIDIFCIYIILKQSKHNSYEQMLSARYFNKLSTSIKPYCLCRTLRATVC